jgi:Flp pilus assembly protein TadG
MGAEGNTTKKTAKGQSLVEFALLVPVMLILVVGISEFGRAWMTRNILTAAAREAVRTAAMPPALGGGNAQGILRGNAILNAAGIPTPPATVQVVDDGNPFGIVMSTVTYTFPLVVAGFVPGLAANFPLTSISTMRREY